MSPWIEKALAGAVAFLLLSAVAGMTTCAQFDRERERLCQQVGGTLVSAGDRLGRGCYGVTYQPLTVTK